MIIPDQEPTQLGTPPSDGWHVFEPSRPISVHHNGSSRAENSLADQATESDQLPDTRSRLRKVGSAAFTSVLAVGAGVSYGFEIGPWNEALRIDKGLEVLQHTHSPTAVGLAVGAITLGIEIIPGALVALGLNRNTGLMKKFNSRLEKKQNDIAAEKQADIEAKLARIDESTPNRIDRITQKTDAITAPLSRIASKGADVGIAFGGGSAMLVAKRHFANGQTGLLKGLKNAVIGTTWIAALSGSVGYLVAGGINTIAKIPFAEGPANFLVEHGASKTFWLKCLAGGYGFLGAKKVYKFAKNKKQRNKVDDEASEALA